jgi:hypothetical protein
MKLTTMAIVTMLFALVLGSVVTSAAYAGDYFNGFEVDTDNWFDVTRVPSGTDGITSASGDYHAITDPDPDPFTRWGGYNDDPACAGGGTCPGAFPAYGYDTSIDVYLNVDGGYANDTRFDFDSAIYKPDGTHRRDFIFNCGFYNDETDSGSNGTPGAGVNRFICSASNNSQPGSAYAKNPGRMPTVVATTSGWYTFLHQFRDDGTGVLTVDLSVLDAAGATIQTWTLSDPTDVIGTTIGGNGYGWMDYNQLGRLALDNAQRTSIVPDPSDFLDHFSCYDVKEIPPKFEKLFVSIIDQFMYEEKSIEVKKPKLICIPCSKDGSLIKNPEKFILKLYEVKKPKPKVEAPNLIVTDQFGEEDLEVKKLKYLAVPATKEEIVE